MPIQSKTRFTYGNHLIYDAVYNLIYEMGLKFENTTALETATWWDTSEGTELEQEEASKAAQDKVKKDTGDATSLVKSGPTSASADILVKKLLFPCQGPDKQQCTCTHNDGYLLNQLMPTLVDGVKRDFCFKAFKSYMKEEGLTRKSFKLRVCNVRTAERLAVTFQDQKIRREGGVAKGRGASMEHFNSPYIRTMHLYYALP